MALKYDYQAFLEVDDDTYMAWTPKLERLEAQTIESILASNPAYDIDAHAETVRSYVEELAVIMFYGDSLTTTLFDYHTGRVASIQEQIRYTNGVSV